MSASTGSRASAFTSDGRVGELRQFAHELSRPVRDDRLALVKSAILCDFHLA